MGGLEVSAGLTLGLELGQLITQGVIGLFQVPFLEFHALHVFCQGADLGLMLVGWALVRRRRWIESRTQLQAAQTSTSSSSPHFLLHLPPDAGSRATPLETLALDSLGSEGSIPCAFSSLAWTLSCFP